MPKKMYPKGNPRKFSDKIALIKQKEALSNASFQSAIHGITEITMNCQSGKTTDIVEIKDNYSSNSYSPESFTSESTALSFNKNSYPFTNDVGDVKMEHIAIGLNNEVFNSCHELSQMNDDYHHLPHKNDVRFRDGSERKHLQTKEIRHSNIGEYYSHNKHLTRLFEPVSSGSLPDVSTLGCPKDYQGRLSDETKYIRNTDHIDLQETLSNLADVKGGKNSRKALLEHLKNRAVQNASNIHPHHIQTSKDQPNLGLTAMVTSPSLYRATGQIHDHDDSHCAGNLQESGHLKHYSAINSPYLSLPHRDRHNATSEHAYRQRHISGNPNETMKYMSLNINPSNNDNDYVVSYKALTPTGYHSNTWFDNTKTDVNPGLLHPPMLNNVLVNENWRRVASDSSIQNSLKHQLDRTPQPNNFISLNDPNNERLNNFKKEAMPHPYLQNQSMTSYKIPNTQNINNINICPSTEMSDYQREFSQVSISSSIFDNMLGLKSPDENLDPSILSDESMFKTPDNVQGRVFVFNEMQNLSEDNIHDQNVVPVVIKNNEYVSTVNNETFMDSYVKKEDTLDCMNCDDNQDSRPNDESLNLHQCYWEQSNDVDTSYTKEPSPKIKPCENLDPRNVLVDIYTDFSSIPDIIAMDADTQRRDSLNWTDEVLGNLNSDSQCGDTCQGRERAMSGYQPMIALTEEDIVKTLSDEY